jgi:basic membrane protein A and related proteins
VKLAQSPSRHVSSLSSSIVHGQFHGGRLAGTLANGGVGLAPYYGLAGRVSPALRAQLAAVKKGIENESVSIAPAGT